MHIFPIRQFGKYPGHALFQALKFDIEEQQRLQDSGYVAEVDRRVDAEPDFDQKVEILREALDRFPDEPHFQSALRLARERLVLVNAIVAKARHYEQQTQFNEALGQWEILRTIHGRYPGLQFEIERVSKRREQQATTEARARWAADIDHHLQAGDYARARSLCRSALEEFPEDTELAQLEKLARQSEERCAEAQRLLAQGEQRFDSGSRDQALDIIRQAHKLDSRSPGIRAVLIDRLIQQARALMDSDWRQARPLIQEACGLDAGNAAAKSLLVLLEDKEREDFVNGALTRARESQTGGNLADAVRHIDEALARHPADPRLLQLQATLSSAQQELERAKVPRREPEPPPEPRMQVPPTRPEPPRDAVPAAAGVPLPPVRPPLVRRAALWIALVAVLAASSVSLVRLPAAAT